MNGPDMPISPTVRGEQKDFHTNINDRAEKKLGS